MNSKPKWVLNATTLTMGGAVQACVNFIIQAAIDYKVEWHFFISKQIVEQLQKICFNNETESLHIFPASPARNYFIRRKIKREINKLAPDIVFTFFGPAYIKFNCPHFLGFADAWVLHPNKFAVSVIPTLALKLKTKINCLYKRYWLKKADFWVVETVAAKVGLKRILGCDENNIAIVSNGCRDIFKTIKLTSIPEENKIIRLLYISAYYPHKNFEIIPEVAKSLKLMLPNRSFIFILTIDKDINPAKSIVKVAKSLGVDDSIDFIGPVDLKDVPALYEESHIAFIPTLLETFSATYSESMTSGLPIITSDFPFTRAVCKDGAFYFKPNNAEHAARMIVECVMNAKFRRTVITKARDIASKLPDTRQKYRLYKWFLEQKCTIKKNYICAA